MKDLFLNPYVRFYLPVLLAVVAIRIPKANTVFKTLNTFLHESGHALIALLCSGQVFKIKLNADTSGEATTASKYWLPRVLVSLAGYSLAAISAYFVFYLANEKQYSLLFIIYIVLACVNLAFWVRNMYGVLWLIGFILICGVLLYFRNVVFMQFFAIFTGTILLVENFLSCLILLKLSFDKPKQSGDALNLQKHTYLPSAIWALVFTVFSGYFFFLTVKNFFLF